MSNTINRPEKITKFLSHVFSNERDRLYFETVREGFGVDFNMDGILVFNYEPNRIELVMPNNAFIVKYNLLRKQVLYNDSNTPNEIHASLVNSYGSITIDMCNTTKNQTQQLNFINRLYGATAKTNRTRNIRNPNLNSYIFAVRKSICKDNSLFKTYTLSEYNDGDYNFTEIDIQEYKEYIHQFYLAIRNIHQKTKIKRLEQLIDIYLQQSK